MNEISRRAAVKSLVLGSLSLAAFGCASDRPASPAALPPPAAPGTAPPAAAAPPAAPTPPQQPGTVGSGSLRAAFTDSDRVMYAKCINDTMGKAPVGRTWRWRNPDSGNSGTVRPTSRAQRRGGQVCRSFAETISLKDGRSEKINGRACQKADGSWEIAG